jgi:hypothetical protein
MHEIQIALPYEIPQTPRDKYAFKCYLKTLVTQLVGALGHPYGSAGRTVGIGFVWETRTGLLNGGLVTVSRRLQRALRMTGIIARDADPYFLTQRLKYIVDGEPNAIMTLREGD